MPKPTPTPAKSTLTPEKHTFDARRQVLGRLASKIAGLLQGKHRPDYAPYLDFPITVEVTNVREIGLTGRKREQHVYRKYTGYPGNLKEIKIKDVLQKNPKFVLQKAVLNMLPKNRLRSRRMRRLLIV